METNDFGIKIEMQRADLDDSISERRLGTTALLMGYVLILTMFVIYGTMNVENRMWKISLFCVGIVSIPALLCVLRWARSRRIAVSTTPVKPKTGS